MNRQQLRDSKFPDDHLMYALNIKKGTMVNHPTVGQIRGLWAIPVSTDEANMLRHIVNIVVFDGIDDSRFQSQEAEFKEALEAKREALKNKEIMTYQDFVSYCNHELGIKDLKDIGRKWKEYKIAKGLINPSDLKKIEVKDNDSNTSTS